MTDKVLITNPKTGSLQIKTLGYFLPVYDIGDTVGIEIAQQAGYIGPKEFIESDIVGIDANIFVDKDGVVIALYMYQLEDGTVALEEEIQYYWEGGRPEEDDIDNDGGAA